MAVNSSPLKIPPMTPKHGTMQVKWDIKYMRTSMKQVIFTDETRATLDGLDVCGKIWGTNANSDSDVYREEKGVMIWAIGSNRDYRLKNRFILVCCRFSDSKI